MQIRSIVLVTAAAFVFQSCKKEPAVVAEAKINFIFKFDSTQARLNGQGQPVSLAVGHAAQSPRFNTMSAHYLELTPAATTLPGAGAILYKAPETSIGGANAIDFSKSNFAGPGQTFLSVL